MIHLKRAYKVSDCLNVKEVSALLASTTQVMCTGFRIKSETADILVLNDAFSEDGAQEYAVIDVASMCQLESITSSWMTVEKIEDVLNKALNGYYYQRLTGKLEINVDHGDSPCLLCL